MTDKENIIKRIRKLESEVKALKTYLTQLDQEEPRIIEGTPKKDQAYCGG